MATIPAMYSAPRTAIARARRGPGCLTVELVDLAAADGVLGEIRVALPEGHGASIEHWRSDPALVPRLFAALGDELRSMGRRRTSRTVRAEDVEEAAVLESEGFAELRRDGSSVTWILDL